jgi:hypothetical protein
MKMSQNQLEINSKYVTEDLGQTLEADPYSLFLFAIVILRRDAHNKKCHIRIVNIFNRIDIQLFGILINEIATYNTKLFDPNDLHPIGKGANEK